MSKAKPAKPPVQNGYLIELPDYPSCIAEGEVPEDAFRQGRDVLDVKTLADVLQQSNCEASKVLDRALASIEERW